MKRLALLALTFACVCSAKEWKPSELDIARHRQEVFQLARDFVVDTFNLQVEEECRFNPVRFNSNGVWGSFDARIKELGDNRFEVQGWLSAAGNDIAKIGWTVHVRYRLQDPEAWRYMKIDEVNKNEPEFLGWKFGDYRSVGYSAEYDPAFAAAKFGKHH